jgi:hypothetical protein
MNGSAYPTNGSAMNRSAMNGSAMNGSAMNGSAMKGSAMNGSALNGSAMKGSAMKGSALHGSANPVYGSAYPHNGSAYPQTETSAYPNSGLNKQKGSAVPGSGMKTGMRQSHSESALMREESGSGSGGLRKARSDPLNEEDEMENEINQLVIQKQLFRLVLFAGIERLIFAKNNY